MKTILALLVLAIASISLADPSQDFAAFASGSFERFSTKDHPKSNGVTISMKYPRGWITKEGERPHIVQKFQTEGGLVAAGISFRPLPLPPGMPKGSKPPPHIVASWFTPQGLKETLPPNTTFISAKSTKIDSLPAGILEYSMSTETAGIAIEVRFIQFSFVYETTIIHLTCSVGANVEQAATIPQRMADYMPVFTLIANSVVVEDKWK